MKLLQQISILSLLVLGCTPLTQISTNSEGNPKTLQLKDLTYEYYVRTIQLHPDFGARANELSPAVAPLQNQNLQLQFDYLSSDLQRFNARIVHCNYDWSKSNLMDLDFMPQYNEFPVTRYEFSTDTQIPYIHYWLEVPPVKLPGNYVLVIYRDSDRNDLILTKRFMVYDNQLTFSNQGNLIGPGAAVDLNQQINFTINYENVDILNPMQDVQVVIRQNQRWDNLAKDLKPSFVRENIKELEYRFYDPEKMFKGGNEFRFFDLRSINYPGRNVASVNKAVDPYLAYIAKDKTRGFDAYAQYNDINGNFGIDNQDYQDISTSNYLEVVFTLESPPLDGTVYVAGAFNYWNNNRENKMTYDSVKGEYRAHTLLKQGWYDYQYTIESTTLAPYYLEGSHFETENDYEILVYYRPYQPRADLLIGYMKFKTNER